MMKRAVLMSEWQSAYEKANGKPAPEIHYNNGWFRIEGSASCWRRENLVKATEVLKRRAPSPEEE